MKMRSKRDQRPLLLQEAPILSDQMPPTFEEEQEKQRLAMMTRTTQQQQQPHTSASGKPKKRPWRRLFGKGGGATGKRKEAEEDDEDEDEGDATLPYQSASSSDPVGAGVSSNGHLSSMSEEKKEDSSGSLSLMTPSPPVAAAAASSSTSRLVVGNNRINGGNSKHKRNDSNSDKQDDVIDANNNKNKSNDLGARGKSKAPTPSQRSVYRNVQSLITNSTRTNHTVSTSIATTALPSQGPSTSKKLTKVQTGSRNSNQHHHRQNSSQHMAPQSSSHSSSPNAVSSSSSSKSISVQKILSRPFGREHILSMVQMWMVHVARAEWEPEESLWKYRVTIQRREGNKMHDFANGFALRSLQDFRWLEQALTNEFLGGLLLPSLSIYLGVADIESCQHEVDSRLLANWLSDTLNGVRGQGEIMLKLTKVEVATCESMDAFLYRTDLVPTMDTPKTPGTSNTLKSPRGRSPKKGTRTSNAKDGEGDGRWNSIFPELCYTDCVRPVVAEPVKDVIKTPVNMFQKCSSPALGNARTFNVQQDSFVEPTVTFDENNSSLAIHSELLKGERDLILSWRTRSLQAMEKLRVLQEQEKHIGAAWKRFAISVSNLFAYEKDVETARLGDSKSRRDLQMPYRKLQKSAVDDCLRILARQKVERSTPSIEAVNLMLSAYVADLSTVQPSVQAYLEGLQLLATEKSRTEALEAASNTSADFESEKMKRQSSTTMAAIQASINEVKKQLVGSDANGSDGGGQRGKTEEERRYRQRQHVQTIENRVLMNEALLKDFLTTLCRTAAVRMSRMAYTYLDKEMAQCTALHDAAMDMKSKINVASKDILSKMIHRHHREEKEDKSTETKLVSRIVNIGSNTKKFSKDDEDDNAEEVEKGVELSADLAEEENRKAKLRDVAMGHCRERIGRWDAKVAMKIMEAVGVSDANVRVEETTRDLRMVRKYAIGLRENVQRCIEALDILRTTILQGGVVDVRDIRDDFMAEMRNLLSLAYLPPSDSGARLPHRLLEGEGIDLSDPAGWKSNKNGTCGGVVSSYTETRDSGTEWLLESLNDLLKEYNQRVEVVESFVYMECVGIQLEKHFNQSRSNALTAFEKKTDITSAINIATRKKMPVLVKELQAKLEAVGADVSHTTVKDAKEAHLESKKLKEELHALAMRRLTRARETSTERAIALMTVWAKEEESSSTTEKTILEELKSLLEKSISKEELVLYVESSPARIL